MDGEPLFLIDILPATADGLEKSMDRFCRAKHRLSRTVQSCIWPLLLICLVACGSSGDGLGSGAAGGGGPAGTGGAPEAGRGAGGSNTGGISGAGSGAGGVTGTSGTGGVSGSGGVAGTGGASGTGGVSGTGGTSGTGGASGGAPDASGDTRPLLDASSDTPVPDTGLGRDGAGDGDSAVGGGDGGDAATDFPPERVMRIQVDWTEGLGFVLVTPVKELSGTVALARRAQREDPLGSFVGIVSDPVTGQRIFQRTIGMGYSYLPAVRAVTFRYPERKQPFKFSLRAENATSGAMETVLEQTLDPATFETVPAQTVELIPLRVAQRQPALIVNFYSEGYLVGGREKFLADARSMVRSLETTDFPNQARMEFRAVWSPSSVTLGSAQNLGTPIPERNSFLGLYYPYWLDYSRWNVIVYPTRERRFRNAIGQVPYDYPIAIMDTTVYTNVGNYNELTAVANGTGNVQNLLLHELGHYFGLNEEYNNGGTELVFARGLAEPWSQNMTFQTNAANIKWRALIKAGTPIPTPTSSWTGDNVGAYPGGYGGLDARSHVPVPDRVCIMSSGSSYCPVCRAAIAEKVLFDLGE